MQLRRTNDAFPKNIVPLAAALRPLGKQDAFLGIFCLAESLWWVCVIVRGIVAADGDEIFGTEEEARAAASKLRLLIEDVGMAEVAHATPEASREYLTPLLWPEPSLMPLHDANRRRRLSHMGIAVFLLLTALYGANWIYEEYQAREEARLAAELAVVRDAQRKDQLAHPERYFRQAWLDAPSPLDAGLQCSNEVLALPLAANAWTLEEAICTPSATLRVAWAHRKGASFVAPPVGARIVSPQQAAEDRALKKLSARLPTPTLLGRNGTTALLYQITQNTGSQLTLSWEAPEQFVVDGKTSVAAPWQRGSFTFSNLPAQAMLGSDFFDALDLPGVMFTTLTLQNSTWTIKGYIYVYVS